MKLPHIMRALRQDPWLITDGGYMAVNDLVESRLSGRIEMTDQELRHLAFSGRDDDEEYRTGYAVYGDTAVIQVKGTIIKGASAFQKSCGACSPEDIESDLNRAMGDPMVQRIVLDCNSPGGHVRGVPELAEKIAAFNARKRIRAFIDGMGCSALYFLVAGCHSIYATATSDVGSIGVLMVYEDMSGAYAQKGIKPVVFAGGRLKGQGTPGTSLSPEMVAHLTERTQLLYDQFTSHVSTYRKRVQPDTMQGQSFLGVQAAQNGLIDGIADNINEVIAKR